jgi:hypothetical protein
MKILKSLLLGLCLLSFNMAFSSTENTEELIPNNFHIYSLNGNTYVDHLATGCSGKRYYLPTNHQRYETIVAVLLAAQMGQRNVQLRFDGCNSNNQGKIVGVYLK